MEYKDKKEVKVKNLKEAIELAKKLNGEIISGDSIAKEMWFYL